MKLLKLTARMGILSLYLLLISLISMPALAHGEEARQVRPVAILIHGFLSNPDEMNDMGDALKARGYDVILVQYDSRKGTITTLADQVFAESLALAQDRPRIDIVTHSMGGLLTRSYLERHSISLLGRVVMLAPPNHGSEVSAELMQYQLYREFAGPAGAALANVKLQPYKVGNYDLGIIAGTASVNPIFSQFLPGPDDGYVALESTPLRGMNDFITIPTSHGLITHNKSAIEQTIHFLDNGNFDHDAPVTGYFVSTDDFRNISKTVSDFFATETTE